VAGPIDDNVGFWTDSNHTFVPSEFTPVTMEAFKLEWTHFIEEFQKRRNTPSPTPPEDAHGQQGAEEFLAGLGCNPIQITAIQAYYDDQIHRGVTRLLVWTALAITSYTFLTLLYMTMQIAP
jgi:hypothetical protein